MNSLGLIISVLMLAGMFILLRRIERWLHQHIFKVGWLLTQNYQTTTILYYTFFLPGVVLHEVILWLAAGMFNVRSERSLKWPEAQEVGELKLNFVQLTGRSHPYRKALITIMPTLIGIVAIWLVANNIFDIMAVVETMSTGELTDVAAGFSQLTGAPLFWLWVYIIFCIANTMYPIASKDLKGWRTILLGVGVLLLAVVLLGLGGTVFEAISTPLNQVIDVLLATLVLIIGIDVLMVLVLGLIEYTIERITGNSATFRRGKMITMTREEAIEERQRQRELAKRRAERQRQATETVYNSVYDLAFTIPGGPGEIPVTQLHETAAEDSQPAALRLFGDEDVADDRTTAEDRQQELASRISFPQRQAPPPPETPAAESTEKQGGTIEEEADAAVGITRQAAKQRQPDLRFIPKKEERDRGDFDEASSEAQRSGTPEMPAEQTSANDKTSPPERDEQRSQRATRLEQLRRAGRKLDQSPPQRPDEPTTATSDEDKEPTPEEPAASSAPAVSRFEPRKPEQARSFQTGLSPFKRGDTDQDDSKQGESQQPSPAPPVSTPTTSRFGIRPFNDDSSDDDSGDDEQSAARRARARDATADLFKGNEPDEDEDEETLADDTPPANVSGLGKPRSLSRSTRFGSSRPVPKPFTRTPPDDADDDEEPDEIVYEDIDAPVYEDDDDYIDYDDEDDIDYADDD